MHLNKFYSKWALPVFCILLTAGVIVVTQLYLGSQLREPNEPVKEELTDREKQLLGAEADVSKWLLGIASGALVGLVGLRLKNPGEGTLTTVVPMSAYSFLLLSIYGGFLSFESTLDILRRGPLVYVYADQFKYPVLIQFWSLVAALALLAVWFFPGTKKTMVLAIVTAIFCASNARAQETDRPKCVQTWYQDRLHAPTESGDLALSLLRKVEVQPNAKPIKTCIDADSVMDQLRFSSFDSGKKDTVVEFNSYLKNLSDELNHPDLSMSDVVAKIVDLMSPWDKPVAVLAVRSDKGTYQIILNAAQVGITNWARRLVPGTYRIRVVKDLRVVYSSNGLSLAPGENRTIDIDNLPQ